MTKLVDYNLPKAMTFNLIETDDFLFDYSLRDIWSPFEAACLLSGYKPGRIDEEGHVRVDIFCESFQDEDFMESFSVKDNKRSESLLDLATTIAINAGTDSVRSRQVTDWAVSRHLINRNCRLARAFRTELAAAEEGMNSETIPALPSVGDDPDDGRGKHHEKKRMAILGAVISEMATYVAEEKIANLHQGQEVNATALAAHLHQYRRDTGLPDAEERGFSHDAILSVLREALRCHKNLSPNKK
jgi:hypothetical protein